MELCPDLLAGLPARGPKTLARILECHHEQIRALVLARGRARGGTLAVVDLGLLAGEELKDIEAVRFAGLQRRDEPLHRVVLVGEAVALDEILEDAHRVPPERHLHLDPGVVRLARRDRVRRRRHQTAVGRRWPGWGSLGDIPRKAGGHPGGVYPSCIAPDGLPVDAGSSLNLALRHARAQQRLDHNP